MIKKRDKSQLEKVFDDHSKWIKTVKGFGATKEDAEDIVGEMYLTIGKMINKGLDISYKDEVNYYYIYIALKTRFINMIKKKNKYPTVEILDDKNIDESESVNYEEAQNILEAELDLMMLDKKQLGRLDTIFYSLLDESRRKNTLLFVFDEIHKIKGWENLILVQKISCNLGQN